MGWFRRNSDEDQPPAEEWFRRTTWSPGIAEAFETKLARKRSEADKIELLRIQGITLMDTGEQRLRAPARELLERAVAGREHYPEAAKHAHMMLGELATAEGDAAAAARHYRAASDSTNQADEVLAGLLSARPELAERQGEADSLLDAAMSSGTSYGIFLSQQFDHCLVRARERARAGETDAAAFYATAALWLHARDHPTAPRHPTIGLIGDPGDAVEVELHSLAAGGDPESVYAIGDEYRTPDGQVNWRWELVREYEAGGPAPSADSSGPTKASLVRELTEAGFDLPFGLANWSVKQLPTAADARRAAGIMLDTLERSNDPHLHWSIGIALCDPRIRKLAADRVLEAFARRWTDEVWVDDGGVPPPAVAAQNTARSGLGNALASLARDEQFERMVELIEDASFTSSGYLYWALPYVKDPRAVDYALKWLARGEAASDREHLDPLRLLADLRSERGEPALRRYAEQEKPKARTDAAAWKRLEIEIAQGGLDKLEKARAKGKTRP